MTLETLIENDRWTEARASLRRALKKEPRHHWLLTRLSLNVLRAASLLRGLEVTLSGRLRRHPLARWCYGTMVRARD